MTFRLYCDPTMTSSRSYLNLLLLLSPLPYPLVPPLHLAPLPPLFTLALLSPHPSSLSLAPPRRPLHFFIPSLNYFLCTTFPLFVLVQDVTRSECAS